MSSSSSSYSYGPREPKTIAMCRFSETSSFQRIEYVFPSLTEVSFLFELHALRRLERREKIRQTSWSKKVGIPFIRFNRWIRTQQLLLVLSSRRRFWPCARSLAKSHKASTFIPTSFVSPIWELGERRGPKRLDPREKGRAPLLGRNAAIL